MCVSCAGRSLVHTPCGNPDPRLLWAWLIVIPPPDLLAGKSEHVSLLRLPFILLQNLPKNHQIHHIELSTQIGFGSYMKE